MEARDALERHQQLQKLQAELAAVPWPDEEDLRAVDEEGDDG